MLSFFPVEIKIFEYAFKHGVDTNSIYQSAFLPLSLIESTFHNDLWEQDYKDQRMSILLDHGARVSSSLECDPIFQQFYMPYQEQRLARDNRLFREELNNLFVETHLTRLLQLFHAEYHFMNADHHLLT